MPLRRACLVIVACACAVAGLAGCSSGPVGMCANCRIEVIPGRAYALDVMTAGRVRWRVRLGPPTPGSGLQASPLAVGAVAVFAQGQVLYGLRLSDGHRLWSRAFSQDIAGMWRWQNLVVVSTQPTDRSQSPPPVLTGLDASTGRARWTLPGMGGGGDRFSATADGGLATVVDQDGVLELEVVDLSSGRVRWTRRVDSDAVPPVAVGGGALVFAGGADGDANSSLTSYDDRTGQVRWTEALSAADEVVWQASAGLVYVTGAVSLGSDGQGEQVLLGISTADGRPRWRAVFRFAYTSPPATLDPAAPGLMSFTTSAYPGGTSLDELDPATGRVRWHVVSPDQAIATTTAGIIVTAPGPDGTDQISVRDTMTGRTRWTAELTEPLPTDPWQASPALPVFRTGPLLVVPAASPDGSELLAAFRMSDGHRAWQITIPGWLAAQLSAMPGGMLVYAAIPQRIFAP
jgi:outer membrane protein assembly factor BamB